jgi:hypothetical protein
MQLGTVKDESKTGAQLLKTSLALGSAGASPSQNGPIGFGRRDFGFARRDVVGFARRDFGFARRDFGFGRRDVVGFARRDFGFARRECGLGMGRE